MTIGLVSDIHGNVAALEAVLHELDLLGVDRIYSLGDVIDPLPGSRKAVETLLERNIPSLRGNHEDYVVSARIDPEHTVNTAFNFAPVRLVAQTFDSKLIDEVAAWPLTQPLSQPATSSSGVPVDGPSILLCHASPKANNRGWWRGKVDEALARDLNEVTHDVVVCGHWHDVREDRWRDKTLVSIGSVGLPLKGRFEAEFALLHLEAGRIEPRVASYDVERTVDEYLRSGWFEQGGPIAWNLMIELATAQRRMSPFFSWLANRTPKTEKDWSEAVREFLEGTGDWPMIERLRARA